MNKLLNVFFSLDVNYIQHFTVAATSLLENNNDLPIQIWVVHNLKDVSLLNRSKDFFKGVYNQKLKLIDIGNIDFSRFTTNANYTSATYFRLFLADILPKDIDTGLILDSDLIITGSIRELAKIDVKDKYLYAASEAFVEYNVNRLTTIGLKTNGYFNAGVILANLKAWRQDKLTEKFISIADEYMDKLEWYDQDILNVCFADNWGEFNKKYNAVHLTRELPVMPVIVHFASYSKPWYYVDTHPYNYLYWKYLKLTPYKGRRSTGLTLKNFFLKNGRLFKRRLRKAGLLKYPVI